MFVIWHDNDYDLARWVYLNSSLSKIGEKVLLRPIPKTNSSGTLLRSLDGDFDHHILPVIKYETPDIIIQKIDEKSKDSEIVFVTEFMTHTPQHHHPLQRFSRIYGASNLKVPSALIIPNTKVKLERKNGTYKSTSYKANPLIYHIFIKTTDVNKTPTLLFLWPDIKGYLKYDKKHPTAPFINDQIQAWFNFLNSAVQGKKDVESAKTQYELMMKVSQYKMRDHKEFVEGWKDIYKLTTIRIEKTEAAIKEFKLDPKKLPAYFLKNEDTLIFEPEGLHAPSTPFRTDPYAGMLCAFDNLFCREGNGVRVLNLVLRAKNIRGVTERRDKNMMRNHNDDRLIERAIIFLVTAIDESGRNPKPVILHSVRVAIHLENLGYSREVVIGAILHDLLEDTDVTSDQIRQEFSKRVADLVEANSFQKGIVDETECYKRMYDQCIQSGKDALIIKAADILDNSHYYGPREDLIKKMGYFVNLSRKALEGETIRGELAEQYERIAR
jgi:hypothetical protein